MKYRIKKILLPIACGIILFPNSSYAVDVPIKIHGAIRIPPCKINNDADFNVSFGKISLQSVDGDTYTKSVSINVTCENFQGKPYIYLSGGTGQLPGAPDNVLNTNGVNKSALGIALYQGGGGDKSTPLRIGSGDKGKYGYEITKGMSNKNVQVSTFTFSAVPYKQGGGSLRAGTFSASVTMNINYL
ncbi:fimbrial protein [Klebsiella aerogenes]|nr:fimbrial protein [Klebsiella aerogenes]ELY3087347.1 fimbrial protein [Klebsiella aerogenes]